VIRATIPSRLEYRDVAIRLVASACRLVRTGNKEFYNEVISAFSEALNNVIIHGCESNGKGIDIEIEPGDDGLTIRLIDHGKTFDPLTVPPPDLDSLPESGLGTFIMRSFMDEIAYARGSPNTLTMTKYVKKDGLR
jgi:anti-sigma regulatory factor (Ser/Thr protein kinase)